MTDSGHANSPESTGPSVFELTIETKIKGTSLVVLFSACVIFSSFNALLVFLTFTIVKIVSEVKISALDR